jgi:hypothetical protein
MVLIGGEHRCAHQREPDRQRPLQEARQMPGVEPPENDEESNLQRGRLVERPIEAGQRGEQKACKAAGLRLLKRELERKQHEADDRHDLRGEQAPAMVVELGPGCADKKRKTVRRR